jgi:hypothetical protein
MTPTFKFLKLTAKNVAGREPRPDTSTSTSPLKPGNRNLNDYTHVDRL